jgi:uncharacterized protein
MYTNALIYETSPYLLQHAHNPVNWYPWGQTALEKAKKEHKMLLISIGYAACHWCHVMEHESFEDIAIAKIMNENFVCIKVDREERPDVDQVYMNAAVLVSGRGGWPLNAFAMPDGKPFYAGTYYPPEKWVEVLTYFGDLFHKEREKMQQQADYLSRGIREFEYVPKNVNQVTFEEGLAGDIYERLMPYVDMDKGGLKGSIKFPMPSVWEFLLQYYTFSGNDDSLRAVIKTLTQMAEGGIYDQIGGGFARYATDPDWHAPHFEKMLYDNAQLISLYSHAYQLTHDMVYKKVVYETVDFLRSKFISPEKGFFSSIDADSEGEEGKYYVWTASEIRELSGPDAPLFMAHYGITDSGNWEAGKNIPDIREGDKRSVSHYGLTEKQFREKIELSRNKLRNAREKRIPPTTDTKILTSWNAMMVIGLLDAYRAFGDSLLLEPAQHNLDFLLENVCTKEGGLFRNYKDARATIPAFLDDYAFLIRALIENYQVSFNEGNLERANSLTQYVITHFYDPVSGMFFYTDGEYSNLIARKMEVSDNVIPASNSVMAKNLFYLGTYFEGTSYVSMATQMVVNVLEDMKKSPTDYSNWFQLLLLLIRPPYEIAVVGPDWNEKLKNFQENFLPNVVYLGGQDGGKLSLLENKLVKGKTMIYVCENKTCGLPVESVSDALQQIGAKR